MQIRPSAFLEEHEKHRAGKTALPVAGDKATLRAHEERSRLREADP